MGAAHRRKKLACHCFVEEAYPILKITHCRMVWLFRKPVGSILSLFRQLLKRSNFESGQVKNRNSLNPRTDDFQFLSDELGHRFQCCQIGRSFDLGNKIIPSVDT
jgi:hypothetical protein